MVLAIPFPQEFSELKEKHLGRWKQTAWIDYHQYSIYSVDGVADIREKYNEEAQKKWVEDYEDELNEEINDKLTCWDGDVRTAKEDVEEKFNEIQDKLDEAKEDDPKLAEFKEELEKVEWGEDELEAIEEPLLKEQVKKVIDALQAYLKELEDDI